MFNIFCLNFCDNRHGSMNIFQDFDQVKQGIGQDDLLMLQDGNQEKWAKLVMNY